MTDEHLVIVVVPAGVAIALIGGLVGWLRYRARRKRTPS